MAASKNFVIEKGKTFSQVLRWESQPVIYKLITGVSRSAPVRITAPSHGIPNGWRVAVVSVKGMTQINASSTPPKERDYYPATVVDSDTIELNSVNSADYKPYSSGGYLQYNTPTELDGFTARMSIKDKVGGTELLRFDTTPGLTDGIIVIDDVNYTITLELPATLSELLTFKKGVYDLELVSSTGVVTGLLQGSVTVAQEVTTD